MKSTISEGLLKLKTYWKTPPKGYQVSYKEFVNLSMGYGGISFLSVLITWTTIAMNIQMMITYFKVTSGMVFVLTMLSSLIALVRSPILSMIIDNSNSEKGKFKPFLIWSAILTAVSFGLIPYIPQGWTENILWSFSIPEIPILGVAASKISLSLAVVVMFVLIQIGTFFSTLLNQAMAGIEQTISSVAQERANIGAFRGLICNIPSSVVNVVMPAVAGAFFSVGAVTGMNNIWIYRIFFPICSVGGVFFVLFAYFGTKERIVVNKKYVAKVKFWESAKELSSNKYFWIITILGVVVGIRGQANIYLWVCTYGIGGNAGDAAMAVCNIVLNNALVPGMIFGPMLIKRFGKRNCLLVANTIFVAMVAVQLAAVNNPYLILVCIFFQNLCGGFYYIATIMVSDVLDYQQWKTGKRLEGFWQNYTAFISTLIGLFTGMLAPLFLSFGGIGFGDDINVALQNHDLMVNAFKYTTILALIGAVLSAVPMFFYNLTEKKHADYVRVLKLRAATDNYKSNELQDEDIINVTEIIKEAREEKNEFVLEEMKKYSFLDNIASGYDEAMARLREREEQEKREAQERENELKEKSKMRKRNR